MQIVVTSDGAAQLADPDDCREFSVRVDAGDGPAALAALIEQAGIGELDPNGTHIQVSVAAVRGLADGRTGPNWNDDFEAMIAYARTKGWVDDTDSRIRAHIESGP